MSASETCPCVFRARGSGAARSAPRERCPRRACARGLARRVRHGGEAAARRSKSSASAARPTLERSALAKDKGAAWGAHRPRPQHGAQPLHQPRRRILRAQAQHDGQRADRNSVAAGSAGRCRSSARRRQRKRTAASFLMPLAMAAARTRPWKGRVEWAGPALQRKAAALLPRCAAAGAAELPPAACGAGCEGRNVR